eukprot:1933002-Pyramimonas_sp.AAC.1
MVDMILSRRSTLRCSASGRDCLPGAESAPGVKGTVGTVPLHPQPPLAVGVVGSLRDPCLFHQAFNIRFPDACAACSS